MPLDESWMEVRSTTEYYNGVISFLDYAYRHVPKLEDMKIYCPCRKCSNRNRLVRNEVHEHFLFKGTLPDYTTWFLHGENIIGESESEDSYAEDGEDTDNENGQNDGMHKSIEDRQDPKKDAEETGILLAKSQESESESAKDDAVLARMQASNLLPPAKITGISMLQLIKKRKL